MKINKRIVLSLLIVLCASAAMAQGKKGTFSFTPQVGVSLGKLSGNDIYVADNILNLGILKLKQRYRAGFTVGGEVSYQYMDPLAFSLGVFYTQTGTKYDNYQEDGEKSGWGLINNSVTLSYVSVPLMASFYVAQGFAVKAGLEVNFNTLSKQQYDMGTYTINEQDGMRDYAALTHSKLDQKEYTCNTSLTLPIGVSYEYERVVLDARYHLPLTKTMNDPDHVTSSHLHLFTVTVGYRF